MSDPLLRDRRILVVEDEYLIADDLDVTRADAVARSAAGRRRHRLPPWGMNSSNPSERTSLPIIIASMQISRP